MRAWRGVMLELFSSGCFLISFELMPPNPVSPLEKIVWGTITSEALVIGVDRELLVRRLAMLAFSWSGTLV